MCESYIIYMVKVYVKSSVILRASRCLHMLLFFVRLVSTSIFIVITQNPTNYKSANW